MQHYKCINCCKNKELHNSDAINLGAATMTTTVLNRELPSGGHFVIHV